MTAATNVYLEPEKPPVTQWVVAACVILLLHGLLAYVLLHSSESAAPGQESPPAIMIDMAPLATAPPASEDSELPPAPEKTEEAPPEDVMQPEPEVTPPEPTQMVIQEKPPEIIVPESPLAPKPEVVIAQAPKPPPPPKVKPLKKVEKVVKPVHKPQADKTAAPRRLNAAASRETAASEAGVPSMSSASWQSMVSARLNSVKRCPAGGSGSGTASVGFSISGGGGVGGAHLVRSSGNPALDAEAVGMVHRAAPFPPTPSGGTVSLTVPIHFGC